MADQLISVPLSELHDSPDNLREDWGDIAGLAKTIDEQGLIEPIITRKRENGGYWIVAGARRSRALKHLGRKKAEVIVREYDRQQAFDITVIENAHRASINAVELAASFARMKAEFGYSGEVIAKRLKLKSTYVYDLLTLNEKAVDATKRAVIAGKIGTSHAIEVARVLGERLQSAALADVLRLAKKDGEPPPYRAVKKLIQERYLQRHTGTSKSARKRHEKAAARAADVALRKKVVLRLLGRVVELVERRAHLGEDDMRLMALAAAEASPAGETAREVYERRGLKPSGLSKVGATQLRSLVVELALAPFVGLDGEGGYSAGTKAVARAYDLSLSELEKGVAATSQADALFEK